MKSIKGLLLTVLTMFTLAACGTTSTTDTDTSSAPAMSESGDMQVFTLEELSEFDGKDGNKAYVAVDGVVYDVTNNDAWPDGEHQDGVTAGNDLTEEIMDSPHGESVLEDLPVIGTLEE